MCPIKAGTQAAKESFIKPQVTQPDDVKLVNQVQAEILPSYQQGPLPHST